MKQIAEFKARKPVRAWRYSRDQNREGSRADLSVTDCAPHAARGVHESWYADAVAALHADAASPQELERYRWLSAPLLYGRWHAGARAGCGTAQRGECITSWRTPRRRWSHFRTGSAGLSGIAVHDVACGGEGFIADERARSGLRDAEALAQVEPQGGRIAIEHGDLHPSAGSRERVP